MRRPAPVPIQQILISARLVPQPLITVIGALANALDKNELRVADQMDRIVLRYLPSCIVPEWQATYEIARLGPPHNWDRNRLLAILSQHAPRQAQRLAIATLMASGVKLDQIVTESTDPIFAPVPKEA